MGLPEHEDVRERPISMFTNQTSDGDSSWRSMLWMCLACVVVLFLLYKSFLWWETQQKSAVGSSSTEVVAKPGMGPTDTTPAVIFTDGECPSGAQKSNVTVNTAKVGTVTLRMPEYAPTPTQPQLVEVQAPTVGTTSQVPTRNTECAYLDEQIKQLDSLARQALSAQSQDALRHQRQRLRSRQFELHC